MAALLNISPDAARDLEDNFRAVLCRELPGNRAQAGEIARKLVERLDMSGYRVGREQLHHEDEAVIAEDIVFDEAGQIVEMTTSPLDFAAQWIGRSGA